MYLSFRQIHVYNLLLIKHQRETNEQELPTHYPINLLLGDYISINYELLPEIWQTTLYTENQSINRD